MTIAAPDLDTDQKTSDNGPSLCADPWSDTWALPTAEELKAVGWPGARSPQPADSGRLEAVIDPATVQPSPPLKRHIRASRHAGRKPSHSFSFRE